MKILNFFEIFEIFEIFDFFENFEIFVDDVDDDDDGDDDDNGNVFFKFLSSNFVENCLCPKWHVSESVTTLGIELLSQLKINVLREYFLTKFPLSSIESIDVSFEELFYLHHPPQ